MGTVLFVPSVSIVPPVPIIPKLHLILGDLGGDTLLDKYKALLRRCSKMYN